MKRRARDARDNRSATQQGPSEAIRLAELRITVRPALIKAWGFLALSVLAGAALLVSALAGASQTQWLASVASLVGLLLGGRPVRQ